MEALKPSDNKEESAKKPKGSKKKSSGPVTGDGVLCPNTLSKGDLYKAPTVEELNQLKEAESLFHCSLLKMQVSTAFTWTSSMFCVSSHEFAVFCLVD